MPACLPACTACLVALPFQTDTRQDDLVYSLNKVIENPVVPPYILQTLLNLAEFMEHDMEVRNM